MTEKLASTGTGRCFSIKKIISGCLINLMLLVAAFSAMLPFIYMVLTSLKQVYNSLDINFNPSLMSLKNYGDVWRGMPIMSFYLNSGIVVVGACTLSAVFASMAAYGFVKKRFPGRDLMFNIILFTLMVPAQVTMIPLFILLGDMGLLNTRIAMMLPFVNAFSVLLMKQFMINVPDDLIEAAKIDGSGEATTFIKIVVPILRPVITALVIFIFLASWNDFLWPLIIATDNKLYTITLAISLLSGQYRTNFGMLMAGATFAFLPPFILYMFLQNTFIEGIAYSGIKG